MHKGIDFYDREILLVIAGGVTRPGAIALLVGIRKPDSTNYTEVYNRITRLVHMGYLKRTARATFNRTEKRIPTAVLSLKRPKTEQTGYPFPSHVRNGRKPKLTKKRQTTTVLGIAYPNAVHYTELAKAVNVSNNAMAAVLTQLVRTGEAVREARGLYRLGLSV